jgi:hypothetical protein
VQPPIALYGQLENVGDTKTLSACCAPHAIVRNAGHTYEGLAAITAWKAETKKQYHHTVTPLEIAQQHGKTVLTATLTGDFPNIPVTVNCDFVLKAGYILSLEMQT